ncbi:hypothetical protein FRB99_005351 [Tulasnella sp. 403]|nr:hypothetical protein FRB99_005351 [Tulasnella sp. 403]
MNPVAGPSDIPSPLMTGPRKPIRRSLTFPLLNADETKGATVSSTLSRCHILSKLLKEGGGAVPFVPLSAIGGIACVIIELANDIRTLRGRCASLAEKAAGIVVDLLREAAKVSMSDEMLDHIAHIENVLVQVKGFMVFLAEIPWRAKVWKKCALESRIEDLETELECHYNAFMHKVAISTYRLMLNMTVHQARRHQELLDAQNEVNRRLEEAFHPPAEHDSKLTGVDIIPYKQLELKREITRTPQQTSFFRATYTKESTTVIVKKYPKDYQLAKFIEEIRRYRMLLHVPSLSQSEIDR